MGYGDSGIDGQDWTTDFSNNILIYGGPKEGKTTVAACRIREMMDEDPKSICYVINTDKGFTKPAFYVGLNDPKYKDRIKYFYVNTIKRAIDVMTAVKEEVQERGNPNDIVLFDLLSWSWDEAQKEFVNEISGGEVVGFLAKAMKDPSTFGTFEGLQWSYVKKAEDMVSNSLTRNPICRVIALSRVKDVKVGYKIGKKKEDLWYNIGVPDTRKDIVHEFATIIKIEKFSHDGEIYRRFMIVGDRDCDPDFQWHAYDTPTNFWEQVDAIRGGKPVEPNNAPEPKDVEELTEDDKTELVTCIKESFSNSDFTIDDILEACGEDYAEAVHEIIDQGLKLGKVFDIGGGLYSFNAPKPKEKPKPREVKDEPAPISNSVVIGEISKLDTGTGANVEALVKKMCQYYDKEDIMTAINAMLDKGTIFEPSAGMVKNTHEPMYVERKKEEPVKEVAPVEEDDDGW